MNLLTRYFQLGWHVAGVVTLQIHNRGLESLIRDIPPPFCSFPPKGKKGTRGKQTARESNEREGRLSAMLATENHRDTLAWDADR